MSAPSPQNLTTITSTMKRIFIFLLLATGFMHAVAQQFTITGRITDNGTPAAPLPLARVQLLNGKSTELASQSTNNKGTFTFTQKQAGTYIVRVSFLGFETVNRTVKLTTQKPKVDLGDLQLKPLDVKLGEATVSALSQQLTIKADTFIYNSSAFRVPPGASLAALVKQLPGLSTDAEGNLTFQGKAVSSILINGKPLFTDTQTALSDLPAAAVQNVKAYDKTSDDAEFSGKVEVEKATVLDLTIKKEYMASWNLNLDAGGGTHERWTGRAFASTFTDRRRLALYASGNNISEGQHVDENGNWRHYANPNGKYVYRNVGGMFSWDNGLKNKDGGYFRISADGKLQHNNRNRHRVDETERFLTAGTQYQYVDQNRHDRYRMADANVAMIWNIDTLNRLSINARYHYGDDNGFQRQYASLYNARPYLSNPYAGLVPPLAHDSLRKIGVNGQDLYETDNGRGQNYQIYGFYTRRFSKSGRYLQARLFHRNSYIRDYGDRLERYTYYHPDAPQSEVISRDAGGERFEDMFTYLAIEYEEPVSKHINLGMGYTFYHEKSKELYNLYRLSRYAEYNNMNLPVGARPTTQDSLDAVRDIANSYHSEQSGICNTLSGKVSGRWDKVETEAYVNAEYCDEQLDYDRNGEHYDPERNLWRWYAHANLRWKPRKGRDFYFSYYGRTQDQPLMELLPITDSRDPMHQEIQNPHLKNGWNNDAYFRLNFNNEKTGANYNVYGAFDNTHNEVVTISRTDPVTGAYFTTRDNVNGNFGTTLSFSTTQLLDTARHWTLNASIYGRFSRSKSYVGSMGDALGLSRLHFLSIVPRANLRYRRDKWSVVLNAAYYYEGSHYRETPQYDQDGHTYELTLTPQWESSFGMRLSADLTYYGRTGYASELLNHDQWLLNASISQTFLKNKALTVTLQATDLLRQRTSEYSSLSATARSYSRTDAFLSYVLLQVSYKLNIKKGDKRR